MIKKPLLILTLAILLGILFEVGDLGPTIFGSTIETLPKNYWNRAGTTLSPKTAGDNLTTTGTGQFARLGLGQTPDASAVMGATGQYFATQHTTTTTLDWDTSNTQSIQLASGNNTFTFANPKTGGRYLLRLKQPASGAAGTVTWPSTVHWSGATAPTLTATNSQVDIITFYYDGTSYFGGSTLNYAP